MTLHLASVKTLMPKSEAIERSRMICPVRTNGRLLIIMSHICVDMTWRPSASKTFRGCLVIHLFTMGVPSITKIFVAPESAMASSVLKRKAAPANAGCLRTCLRARALYVVAKQEVIFDVRTVMLLSSKMAVL